MQKGSIRAQPIAIMVLFALSCFGLLLFLWLSFGGSIPLKPKGYRVTAQFTEATTLATEADVRISGVPVGKVKTIQPDPATGRSDVVMQIDSRYAPLRRDVRATLRQKTLLGETYVELTPGSRAAPPIPESGRIPDAGIASSVQLDEIFRGLNPRTRAAFQEWMQEQSKAIGPYARDVNAALGNLEPFAHDTSDVVAILRRQRLAVRGLVSGSADVFEALSKRQGQLRGLVRSLAAVLRTTGGRDRELREAIIALPTFEREARATLRRVDRFADTTNPLVTQLRPAARELSPTLTEVQAIAPDLRALFAHLDPLITASKTGFPATSRLLDDLEPFLSQAHPALQQVIPILQFIAPYKRELTAFFANSVAATQAAGPVGRRRVHYLRTSNPILPELLAAFPQRIGSNRSNAYPQPGVFASPATLPQFETRNCRRGDPVLADPNDPALDEELGETATATIERLLIPPVEGTQVPAPPCKQQGPFGSSVGGTQFPHVDPAP